MADLNEPDNALCIVPPKHLWPQIDRVRSRHDKKFPNWPPHIKLVYPFVPVQRLPMHMEAISRNIKDLGPIRVRLTAPDLYNEDECRQAIFLHVDDTEYVDEDGGRKFLLDRLCEAILEAVQQPQRCAWYKSMTVGHAQVGDSENAAQSLLLRAGLLSGIEWEVDQLHILVREGLTSEPRPEGSRMIDWASISLRDGALRVHQKRDTRLRYGVVDNKAVSASFEVPGARKVYNDPVSQTPEEFSPYFYDGVGWSQSTPDLLHHMSLSAAQDTLTIASYNVCGEIENHSMLIDNILHTDADADVLVLQETTGSFLSHLLYSKHIQERYAFSTQRPIEHTDCDVLPSQKMVVVLSRFAFTWEVIPLPPSGFEPDCLEENESKYDNHRNNDVKTLVQSSAIADRTRTHNRALLLEFRNREGFTDSLKRLAPLALAAFYLTPGRFHESYHARALELDAIKHYVYSGTPAILAGGFNIPTSTITLRDSDFRGNVRQVEEDLLSDGYIDAWLVAKMAKGAPADNDPVLPRFQGEQGCTDEATFPGTVANEFGHSQLGRRPQRLDRILIRSHGLFMVQSFNKFGRIPNADEYAPADTSNSSGSSIASELYSPDNLDTQPPTSAIRDTLHKRREGATQENFHWGVRAVLKLDRGPTRLGNVNLADGIMSSIAAQLENGLSSHLKGHESVLKALRDVHGFPLRGECQVRESALKLLASVLLDPSSTGASSGPGRHSIGLMILPVGSQGLGVWTSSSDLDCLCVGSFSLPTFIDLATQRIRQAGSSLIRLHRTTETYTGTTLELDVWVHGDHLRIDLTYARTTWPLPSLDPTTLSSGTLSALKAYRDLDYVQRSVPDIVAFRLAHRFIKMWAQSRGIYSAEFGYLSGIQITMLLTRVHKRLATRVASPTVPEILYTFFKEYASFDWEKDVVFDEYFHGDLQYTKTHREPLVILSYFPPRLNTSSAATASSVRTITSEFQRAEKLVDQKNGTWADLLSVPCRGHATSGSLAADEFLKQHQYYIKICAQYWGGSTIKGRGFVGWVGSRCVSLLADLEKRTTNVHFRIWPTRFTEKWQYLAEKSDWAEAPGEYQGIFLIGVDWIGNATEQLPGAVQDALESILSSFEQQVRKDESHFDARSMRISAESMHAVDQRMPTPTPQSDRHSEAIHVDDRDWDEYTQCDEDSEDEGERQGLEQATTVQSEWGASSRNRKKPATNQPRSVVVPKPEAAGKFRPAADVLNRLRWDASYDHTDFLVGYEDRFLGAMERGLDMWKSDQTHEEFIPQHRILYFKMKSDGVLVWERRTRTDLVFGSGSG